MRRLSLMLLMSALLIPSAALAQGDPAPTDAPGADAATDAPADTAPAEAAPAPAPSARGGDEPSVEERRMVAYVATGATVVALGIGVTMGFLAQDQFSCLNDVIACNGTLDDPIEGTELLDARAEVEHKALVADMMYLVAGAAAVVAATGFVRGFVVTGEESDASASVINLDANAVAFGGAK